MYFSLLRTKINEGAIAVVIVLTVVISIPKRLLESSGSMGSE